MEQGGLLHRRTRNSSISSLYSEPPIDPDYDLRDPLISSGESTDDECDEVFSYRLCECMNKRENVPVVVVSYSGHSLSRKRATLFALDALA